MDYDAIVGGVGEIDVQSITHGGNEMVVGGSAKAEGRDKILHLKRVPNDVKKLLAIINMARPVVFGHIEYDDGKTAKLKKGPRMDEPDEALKQMLQKRLNKSAADVVTDLVHEYKLREPVRWALTDLIQLLLKHIKNKRPRMRAIKVNGDIGEILDRVRNGDDYFKVATDHKDWPDSLAGVVQELLEILKKERTPSGMWKEPELKTPEWPKMCEKNKAAMDAVTKKKYKTVRDYVEAIVMREHILINHMDAVEMYYVESAEDVKAYTKELASFLKRPKKRDTSMIVKKKVPSSFIVTRNT